jgi:low affinity Fe/Cu permease
VTDRPDGSFHVVEHSSRWTGKVSNLHLRSIDQAQNEMIDIEHLSDDELQKLADKYQKVREECETRTRRRKDV